ncbi:MAG: RcpC/CpaB family pilus assembly protein [Acidimicrobiia bacterium]
MALGPSVISREAGTSSPPAKPVRRRPSLSHILIAVTVFLAFGLNYLALQNRDAEVQVAVAAEPIAEGAVLTAEALRFVPVAADFEAVESLFVEDDLTEMEGRIFARSIPSGGLIDAAALVDAGVEDGHRAMSIPIAIEHAAGARIVVGDRVDVITVVDGVASFVATDLAVIAHAEAEAGSLATGAYHVTVAVDEEEALALAEAIAAGSLEVVRSTGAAPVSGPGD